MDKIIIKGARENNLKNIDLEIPKNKLVVLTGISGSGKTSLAFDTIFAEGQRRYIESLSSYARMFLGRFNKPSVESIDGLSPAISIDQKTTSHNPRSTVGTVTEIYDYMRLLYARVGVPHCPSCDKKITKVSIDQIVDKIMEYPNGEKIIIEAPVVRGRKGEFEKLISELKGKGFLRFIVNGQQKSNEDEIKLDKKFKHSISVIIDRLIVKDGIQKRLTDSLETAIKLAGGIVEVSSEDKGRKLFSTLYSCSNCDISIAELEPRLFSFNSPFGACESCDGLGYRLAVDPVLICGDGEKSISEGALSVSGWNIDAGSISDSYFVALSKKYGFSLSTPFNKLSKEAQEMLLYGNSGEKIDIEYNTQSFKGRMQKAYEGIVPNLERRYKETSSPYMRYEIEKYMTTSPCSSCGGKRLKKEALSVKMSDINIHEASILTISKAKAFFENLKFSSSNKVISAPILKEINARLQFLIDVGLDYLTISRGASSLSGGEAQRIRLATQIGSGLMGVIYILDEPSIGLHQKDNQKLIATLKGLRDLGNSVIVVEHDEETMLASDWLVDIGPGAGVHGGEIVASGTPQQVSNNTKSLTGDFLSGRKKILIPKKRRRMGKGKIVLIGAKKNNLKNLTVEIPLGGIVVVTGVSGSGKSTLVNQILYPLLNSYLNKKTVSNNECKISGHENITNVINIDQSPIGRTPRSNPATYTGVFTPIRELFSKTAEAKARGYQVGRFSFNVHGGRCEHCSGDGVIKVEMNFLPDVFVVCEVCKGKRYNRETLSVEYKGKNISEVLNLTVEEALEFFSPIPQVASKIQTLFDVGLGYIKLGQASTTLSGGEAQRVKLATELSKKSTRDTLYILDEPTTGLHSYDVQRLIDILNRFADNSNTILVIEHNMDIIKTADHIIDLGPEGGDRGGEVIAIGTPEEVAKIEKSYTGQFLKKVLTQR